jgi:hypothetical protein
VTAPYAGMYVAILHYRSFRILASPCQGEAAPAARVRVHTPGCQRFAEVLSLGKGSERDTPRPQSEQSRARNQESGPSPAAQSVGLSLTERGKIRVNNVCAFALSFQPSGLPPKIVGCSATSATVSTTPVQIAAHGMSSPVHRARPPISAANGTNEVLATNSR